MDSLTLPYVTEGALKRQWAVRARSFETFQRRVRRPAQRAPTATRRARGLDLGAGNGWLAHRATLTGAEALALDVRDERVDGLGAAPRESPIARVVGSLEAIPLCDASFDVVVFNASLHYAEDCGGSAEARRCVRPRDTSSCWTRLSIRARSMAKMSEKRADANDGWCACRGAHGARRRRVPHAERLADASRGLGLGTWRRYRVLYPLWYELRAVRAALRRQRPPSRFDVWEAVAA